MLSKDQEFHQGGVGPQTGIKYYDDYHYLKKQLLETWDTTITTELISWWDSEVFPNAKPTTNLHNTEYIDGTEKDSGDSDSDDDGPSLATRMKALELRALTPSSITREPPPPVLSHALPSSPVEPISHNSPAPMSDHISKRPLSRLSAFSALSSVPSAIISRPIPALTQPDEIASIEIQPPALLQTNDPVEDPIVHLVPTQAPNQGAGQLRIRPAQRRTRAAGSNGNDSTPVDSATGGGVRRRSTRSKAGNST